MDNNRITINFKESENDDNKSILLDLFEKNIINEDTFNELYAEESCDIESSIDNDDYDEYDYIYRVEVKTGGLNDKKFYFKEAIDTHWAFDYYLSKIRYIRVRKSSPEYQSAFYNSKVNNSIKIYKGDLKIQNLYDKSLDI